MVPALHHLVELVLHVIAQIIEAVLVVGAVGDVAGIGGLALAVIKAMHDDADREAEEAVDAPHPFRVAAGEVIVHRNDMHALAGKRVEIDRQGRDQRLASPVRISAMPLSCSTMPPINCTSKWRWPKCASRPRARSRRREPEVIHGLFARLDLPAELDGPGAQFVVGEPLKLTFQRVDGLYLRAETLDPPVIGRPKNLLAIAPEHGRTSFPSRPALSDPSNAPPP